MPGTLTICTLYSCRDATTNSFFGARAHIPFMLTLLLADLARVPGWCARLAVSRDPWARWPWA
ncbi:hypothetical protein ACHAO5_003538 [Verticillium nonalfalfae]